MGAGRWVGVAALVLLGGCANNPLPEPPTLRPDTITLTPEGAGTRLAGSGSGDVGAVVLCLNEWTGQRVETTLDAAGTYTAFAPWSPDDVVSVEGRDARNTLRRWTFARLAGTTARAVGFGFEAPFADPVAPARPRLVAAGELVAASATPFRDARGAQIVRAVRVGDRLVVELDLRGSRDPTAVLAASAELRAIVALRAAAGVTIEAVRERDGATFTGPLVFAAREAFVTPPAVPLASLAGAAPPLAAGDALRTLRLAADATAPDAALAVDGVAVVGVTVPTP